MAKAVFEILAEKFQNKTLLVKNNKQAMFDPWFKHLGFLRNFAIRQTEEYWLQIRQDSFPIWAQKYPKPFEIPVQK